MPETYDWIRLAAFIDGEGSICIKRSRYSDTKKLCHLLRIEVVNTDIRLPRWCHEKFGGHFMAKKKNTPKPIYMWSVSAKKAEEIIKGCFEHFLIKREQAEIALAFRGTFAHWQPGARNPLPVGTFELREELKSKLHMLHSRQPEKVA